MEEGKKGKGKGKKEKLCEIIQDFHGKPSVCAKPLS